MFAELQQNVLPVAAKAAAWQYALEAFLEKEDNNGVEILRTDIVRVKKGRVKVPVIAGKLP